MEKQAATGNRQWVITVESGNERHQEIILETIAKRAYQLFEGRGCRLNASAVFITSFSKQINSQIIQLCPFLFSAKE